MSGRTIFPLVRNKSVIERFRGDNEESAVTKKEVIQAFKLGISDVIAIEPELIDTKLASKVFSDFAKAFMTPEMRKVTKIPKLEKIRELGHNMSNVVIDAINAMDLKSSNKSLHSQEHDDSVAPVQSQEDYTEDSTPRRNIPAQEDEDRQRRTLSVQRN